MIKASRRRVGGLSAGQDRRAGRCRRCAAGRAAASGDRDAHAGAGLSRRDGGARRPPSRASPTAISSAAPARLLAGTAGGLDSSSSTRRTSSTVRATPISDPTARTGRTTGSASQRSRRAAADIGRGGVAAFVPDVVHAHDWQGGAGAGVSRLRRGAGAPRSSPIHNLAFQGAFPGGDLFASSGCRRAPSPSTASNTYGGVGYLKAGLQYADAITTVSPTYARGDLHAGGGMGLDGLLRARRAVLHGILNGIDTGVWNPTTDVHLPSTYTAAALGRRERQPRARSRRASGSTDDDASAFLRRQPPHLAEGHGSPRRGDRRAGRAARDSPCSAPANRRSRRSFGRRRAPPRPRRRRRRLRRGARAPAAGRRRRDARPVALRALRADAVLWPALRLRAGGRAGRRPRRHDHRRQRCRAWRGRRDRHPVRTGRRTALAGAIGHAVALHADTPVMAAHSAERHEGGRFLEQERAPLRRPLPEPLERAES